MSEIAPYLHLVTTLVIVFPLAIAQLCDLRRVGTEVDKQILVARQIKVEGWIFRVLQLDFAFFQPLQHIDLLRFFVW